MNRQENTKTLIIVFIVCIPLVVWVALIIAGCYKEDIKLFELLERIMVAFNSPLKITINEYSIKTVFGFLCAYALGIGLYFSTRENRRPGEEHGSAKWGVVSAVCKKYADKSNKSKNLIFTKGMRMGLNGKKHRRNLNVLVVGGSGAGKTRFYAKPNIMQCNTSFVVTDPKGEILRATAPLLLDKGYDVKVFNLINPRDSDGYNPFKYIRTDEDVIKLITNLIQNTTPKNAQQNDPFWEKSEIALDTALMLYLLHEAPKEEQTFEMLMFLIENAATTEDEEDYQSPVDLLFEALEEEKPDHIALKQYKIFKQASGKTAKSILISAAVRLAAFNLPEIAKMTSYDNLELGTLGDKKRALFCVIPDNDNSFNYLVGMLYTQAFQELYYKADHEYGGELPIPVHFVMDEFANVALPDNFERLLATMRSRRISVSIIIQNMAQLKGLFKDNWESLVGNCDTMLYLGGNEQSTHEYISKMLGKETIDTRTRGITKGSHGSSNTNYQNTGRELLTLDEVRLLDNSNALVFIRGEKPVMDKKFDILSHPNIKLTADGGATPYVHSKDDKYFVKNMSVKLSDDFVFDKESIAKSGIELIDLPGEENDEEEGKVKVKKGFKAFISDLIKKIKKKIWRFFTDEK